MSAILTAYLLFMLNQAGAADPRNADVPILTVLLETRDGASAMMKYPAFYWGPDPIPNAEDMADLISLRMGILQNNVQIKIGATTLDPGRYYAGFEIITPELWDFVLSTDTSEWVRVSIPVQIQEEYVPFLSFQFSPGVTDKDFLVHAEIGNFETAMRWVISGVPSQILQPLAMDSNTEGVTMVEDEAGASPRAIQSATELLGIQQAEGPVPTQPAPDVETQPTPTPEPKAGSGAFRHYQQQKEESED